MGPQQDPGGCGAMQDREADPGDGAGVLCVWLPIRPSHDGQGGGLAHLAPQGAYCSDRPQTPGWGACGILRDYWFQRL